MALRQDLEYPCQKELQNLAYVISARADLTSMHEKYMHECHVHNDPDACVSSESVLKSLHNRISLDRSISEFTACLDAQLRRHALTKK